MSPVVEDFRRQLQGLEPRDAEFPLFSTVFGRQVAGHEMNADYWAEQIIAPVRFSDALQAALSCTVPAYLAEAGAKPALLGLALRPQMASETGLLALCSGPDSRGTELLGAAATMMRDGYSPHLSALYGRPVVSTHRLPPYVFDKSNRFWFDPIADHHRMSTTQTTSESAPGEFESPTPPLKVDERAVVDLVAEVGGYQSGALDVSKRLVEDLGYDSLLQLRLLERMRTQYPELRDVAVDEVLPHLGSVGELAAFVVQRLSLSGAAE